MALSIDKLVFDEFRGYAHLELDDLAQLNVIAGPNAVGKTNIVEGLQLLTAARSFRKPAWSETVSWGAPAARLYARFVDDKRILEHALSIQGNTRSYQVNGKKKRGAALRGACPSVLFIPDDLQMVKASSAMRRATLDAAAEQISAGYASLKSDYAQVLRQRNLLLRDDLSRGDLFESWNESLALAGARLTANRFRLFQRLMEHMCSIYAQLVEGEQLSAAYIPSWERFDEEGRQVGDLADFPGEQGDHDDVDADRERLMDAIHRLLFMERRRRTSLLGPHKDEISFYINGKNARMFASQGQQRTIVLAEKLAEVKLIGELSDNPPILLLDDVMSELDDAHREALTQFVNGAAQTFITTANLGYFSDELMRAAHVVEVPISGTRHLY